MSFDVTIAPRPVIAIAKDGRDLPKRVAVVRERTSGVEDAIVVAGLPVLLIFAVLAFGGTDQWAITSLEIGSALLFLFWMWSQISSDQLHLIVNPLYAPVVLFGLIIAVQIVFGLSAYAYVTRVELWKYAAYGSLFLLANRCRHAAAQKLLMILTIFGLIVALFSLIQYLTYDGKIYWFWSALPNSFGPYIDNSHYAGLMEMLTPLAFAMALAEGVRIHEQLLWTFAGVLMAATIFLSGSRGGMVAFAVEMVLFAGLFLTRTSWRTIWAPLVTCLAIGLLVFMIDDGRVLKKLDIFSEPLTSSAVVSRLAIARDMPSMLRARPVAGWGLGVFPIVYPQYRSFPTNLLVNQAHNDYLQALVETGFLGFGCVLWFTVNLVRIGVQTLRANSRSSNTWVLGPLAGCAGILVHSFSDFNLHIPANAALFFVLCGIATQEQKLPGQSTQNWLQENDLAVEFGS